MTQHRPHRNAEPGRRATLHRPADGQNRAAVGSFQPPGWHRAATADDVDTARRIMPLHAPTDSQQRFCASALHLISAPAWPCEQYLWAQAVLAASERREIH